MDESKVKFLHVVIIVSEGNSHVVLSVLLMHALDPQSSQFNVQPIETPPLTKIGTLLPRCKVVNYFRRVRVVCPEAHCTYGAI